MITLALPFERSNYRFGVSKKHSTTILLIFIFFIFFNIKAHCFNIDNSHDEYLLTPEVSWFKDDNNTLTINDMIRKHQLEQFTRHNNKTFNIGFQDAAIWFYLSLQYMKNPAQGVQVKRANSPWLLSIDYPLLDQIDVYTIHSIGGISHSRMGDKQPHHLRSTNALNFSLPVSIQEGESVEIFIKVKTTSLLKAPISLRSSKSSLQHQIIETSIYSTYFGIMGIMIVYNIFIYFSIRETSYIFYIFHITFIILWQASISGHAFPYLWSNATQWAQLNLLIFLSLACYCLVKFSQYFLATASNAPYANTLLGFCSWLAIATTLVTIYLPYTAAFFLGLGLLSICVGSAIYASILCFIRGNKTARFFIFSLALLLISLAIQAMENFGIIATNAFTNKASLVGTLLESIFISLALSDRTNDQRRKIQCLAHDTQQQLQTSNIELCQALADVEQSNRIKDEFLGTISHELRTPMNGVEGALELINTSELNQQQIHYINIAKVSANDMTSVIDSILRFSEIQSRTLQIKSEAFELRSLLNPLMDNYRQQCLQKSLSFNCHIDKNIPMQIIGDSEQILLIIKQLIQNAIKFTEQGEVRVEIYQLELPKKLLCVTVSDSGDGIPQDQLDKIFDSFRQVDGKDNRKHSGLGIGLALCHQLANLMSGSITIDSSVNNGTSITFTTPLRVCHPSPADLLDNAPLANNCRKTILIAEDNPINQMILKGMLEETGCQLLTADNGEQVLQILETHTVDLIMMDCQMPIIDGFEATRIIRNKNSAYSRIPIIAVTANAMTSDNTRCLRAGMNDYIKKPIDLNIVLNKARHWLYSSNKITKPRPVPKS